MSENNLTELGLSEFTRRLASSEPAPGGGGAAALCGALAASLCAMSAKLTAGKKKYADFEEIILSTDEKCERLRGRFLELIELDRQAFLPLQRAYSTDKAKPEREKILRDASILACQCPMEMAVLCGETLELLSIMNDIDNPMLISDVGCGAALCASALECAAMNVLINTRGLKGDEEAERLNGELETLLEEYLPEARKLSRKIMERLYAHGSDS